jgi:hypothetical protein
MSTLDNYPANSSSTNLPPDQFLYGRKGPWPQPSPSHPLTEAAEVLNIPLIETAVWDATVGLRLLVGQAAFPALAAKDAMEDSWTFMSELTDKVFDDLMLGTAYTRYMKPMKPKTDADRRHLDRAPNAVKFWQYDFSAMILVKPLEGLFCAPVVCVYSEDSKGVRSCLYIRFRGDNPDEPNPGKDVFVFPADNAWNLAKIYVLQACAYHMLFVVHPALHFPMDSVNAITKTAVPHTHPLFQLLYPHTSYTLALDNAVLEGPNSVVNSNAQGTWFDPLMGNAYNLKLLFGAGYAGLSDPWYGDAYPPYHFMQPQMGFDSPYGQWLADYFPPFLTLCEEVAKRIDKQDTYVARWARYNSTYVRGFPDENSIFKDGCLAQAMAIFMWDVTVSHGGDHYGFGLNIPAKYKFLRIRKYPPPSSSSAPSPTWVGDVADGDDLFRAELAQKLFFGPHAMPPNLDQTYYPFTKYDSANVGLMPAQKKFHDDLTAVSKKYENKNGQYSLDAPFQPLTEAQVPDLPDSPYPVYTKFSLTIPASIQY